MSLDYTYYIDIGMDIAMITAAYIIYRVAISINFKLAAISDKAVETNKALLESVVSRDTLTLNALKTSLDLLREHVDKVDSIISGFQIKTLEEQIRIAEVQSIVIKNQTEILNNQTEFFKRLKELYDQHQDLDKI